MLGWAVPIQFHAVVVWITQVERLADAMIDGAVQRYVRFENTPQGFRQRAAT